MTTLSASDEDIDFVDEEESNLSVEQQLERERSRVLDAQNTIR
jgi:hypothetical protein